MDLLDRLVDITAPAGLAQKRVPLAEALVALMNWSQSRSWARLFLGKLGLTTLERLELLERASLDERGLRVALHELAWERFNGFKGKPAETAWARACVGRMIARLAATPPIRPATALSTPVFAALLAAKVPLEPAWWPVLPLSLLGSGRGLSFQLWSRVPEPQRGELLGQRILESTFRQWHDGLLLLERFPSRALMRAVLQTTLQPGEKLTREKRTTIAVFPLRTPELQLDIDAFLLAQKGMTKGAKKRAKPSAKKPRKSR